VKQLTEHSKLCRKMVVLVSVFEMGHPVHNKRVVTIDRGKFSASLPVPNGLRPNLSFAVHLLREMRAAATAFPPNLDSFRHLPEQRST
jgi:hypothetical protein